MRIGYSNPLSNRNGAHGSSAKPRDVHDPVQSAEQPAKYTSGTPQPPARQGVFRIAATTAAIVTSRISMRAGLKNVRMRPATVYFPRGANRWWPELACVPLGSFAVTRFCSLAMSKSLPILAVTPHHVRGALDELSYNTRGP